MGLRCKVAVIGAGRMAREHIRAFADVPGVEVAGVHSRTHARAEALARELRVPQVCGSVAELYDKTRAHLVVIAVPELAANPVSAAAFEFPWTALLEKPPGFNLADAQSIRAAAKAKRRNVYVALNRRFLSSTRAALGDVAGLAGPRFIHVQDQEDPDAAAATYGHPPEVAANWMYANSIHVIDYLRLFGRGEVTTVRPVFGWDRKVDGSSRVVAAAIEFASGDRGLYEGVWWGPGPWAVSVTTAEKRWEMRPLERAFYQCAGERKLVPVEPSEWDAKFKPGLRLQAEQAVAAALGEPSEAPCLDDALETMRLIHAIFGV